MSHRANILGRLRRWNTRSARPVVAWVAVAYLSAGAAPCAAAPSRVSSAVGAAAAVHDHAAAAHESHATSAHAGHAAHHQQHGAAAHSRHDHHEGHGGVLAPAHDTAPHPVGHGGHCAHCPAAAGGAAEIAHGNDHASCAALEDLANVAAAHVKDAPPPLAPALVSAAFTWPPPLASPLAAPPSRAARIPAVPLNVRHCVFLI